MTGLDEVIGSRLKAWGKTPALVEIGQEGGSTNVSAEALSRGVAETALKLLSWGIREKYLVPVFLRNSVDFIVMFLALMRVKAIPVMAKMEYRELELSEIFKNAQPQAVVTESDHLGFLGKYLNGVIVIVHSSQGVKLLQAGEVTGPAPEMPDEVATINYTYRGYGYPLGSMVPHSQYLHGARVFWEGLRAEQTEKTLVILPMSHIFTLVGCVVMPLVYKMTAVVLSTLHPRRLFDCIREHQIDHITAIPEIYGMLARVKEEQEELPSLKVLGSGGSLLTEEEHSAITRSLKKEILQGYGLTEFTPVSCNRRYESRGGTVGPVCDEVNCMIKPGGSAGEGEILIKAVDMGGSYYRRSEESREANEAGWFKTGDVGRFENGHLVFVRELKRTCKVNGNLVDLEEVSRAICSDKEVAKACVTYEKRRLVARVGISKRVGLEEKTKELRAYLKENLAAYKIPNTFTILE